MAFKTWKKLFGKTDQELPLSGSGTDITTPTEAELSPDSESELAAHGVQDIEQGLRYLGRMIDHLDTHLDEGNKLLAGVAREQEKIPDLIREMTQTASANREMQQSMAKHLRERDEVSRQLLGTLQTLNESFSKEQRHHKDELHLVMRMQRASRRVMFMLLMFTGIISLVLLLLVLLLALRPDLIKRPLAEAQVPTETVATESAAAEPASDDEIWNQAMEALESPIPEIRDTAKGLLQKLRDKKPE